MKLNYKRTIIIGFAFMAILAFWQFYDQVIPFLLEKKFGLTTLEANGVMSVDNILAIFMLPLFGAISDRTSTRLGRRTPYILFGTLASVILLIIIGISTQINDKTMFFVSLFLVLFVMSIYRTPAVAYMPDVTPKPLRSKANAIINLVGYIGGIFATVVMMFMLKSEVNAEGVKEYSESQSFLPVFIVIGAFMLVSVLFLVFSINENKLLASVSVEENDQADDLKTTNKTKLSSGALRSLILILFSVFFWYMAYNSVTTAFSRYCMEVLNADLSTSSGYLLTATVSAIIAFIPLAFLSGKVGRKTTILAGVALMTVCYAVAIFIKAQTPVMYAIFGLVGIGWAAINTNSFPMVVEMCTGADVGKYTGYYYTFSMAAQIVTPLLSGLLIDKMAAGYNILFPYAVAFSAMSFVTMLFVKHGDSKPKAKASMLENFNVED